MFASSFPVFRECKPQETETFCYEFSEKGSMDLDTTTLRYEWDFGDGTRSRSVIGSHCYSETGFYLVALNVIDTLTGDVYFSEATFDLMIEPLEQPFITAPDTVYIDDKINFNSELSVIRTFEPKEYFWDFGDGNLEVGPNVDYTYARPGTYYVRLGITSGDAAEEELDAEEIDYTKRACSQRQIIVLRKNN